MQKIIVILQGKGYGGKIFDFAESLAKITQIDCVSCRTDLFPFYEKRGYIEIERVPAEEYDEMKGTITRSGLEMVIMQKSQEEISKCIAMTLRRDLKVFSEISTVNFT